MKKVTITISNSANMEEIIVAKVFKNESKINSFIERYENDVKSWNSLNIPIGNTNGIILRYVDVKIEKVNNCTTICNLNLKHISKMINYNNKRNCKSSKKRK